MLFQQLDLEAKGAPGVSLKTHLAIVVVVIMALVVLVSGGITSWWLLQKQEQSVEQNWRLHLEKYSSVITRQMSTADYAAVSQLLESLNREPELVYLKVEDKSGFLVSEAGDKLMGDKAEYWQFPLLTRQDSMIVADSGFLTVSVKLPSPDIFDYSIIGPALLLVLLSAGSLAAMIFVSINRSVAIPLLKLQHSAEHFDIGQTHLGVDSGTREIRSLSNSLDRMAQRITEDATTDSVTGLYNRAFIERLIKTDVNSFYFKKQTMALFFIDIDHFKYINDDRGHIFGDELLYKVADRLKLVSKETDRVGRFGGDEFIVLAKDISSAEDMQVWGANLVNNMSRAYYVKGQSVHITVSAGGALMNDVELGTEELLSQADTALYEAKRAGRNRFIAFQQTFSKLSSNWNGAVESMEAVLTRGAISHEVQPIMNTQTGDVEAAELLLRLPSLDGESIFPAPLAVAVAESSGREQALADATLVNANLAGELLAIKYGAPVKVTINLSVAQLLNCDLELFCVRAQNLLSSVDRYPIIEVTEEGYLEGLDILRRLQYLSDNGFSLALDDFGSGYASYVCLATLPLSYVKLDKSFICGVPENERTSALVESMIETCKKMNLKVIAEGVEREEEFEFLKQAGCDYVQGFWVGVPFDFNGQATTAASSAGY